MKALNPVNKHRFNINTVLLQRMQRNGVIQCYFNIVLKK